MIATSFEEENVLLHPPEGAGPDECEPLPVWRGQLTNGCPVIISCWKITKGELEELQRTGRVWLTVIGTSSPPVHLCTQHPFKESTTDGNQE